MYWLVGYNLMGIEEGGYIGELFSVWSADDSAIGGEAPDFQAAMQPVLTGTSKWCSAPPPRRLCPAPLPSA